MSRAADSRYDRNAVDTFRADAVRRTRSRTTARKRTARRSAVQLPLGLATDGRQAGSVLNLLFYDLIVICSSAGKDSLALLAYVAKLIRQQKYRGRVVVLHNTLGVTRSGESVEWWGVEAAAREHAAAYGFEFVVRRPGASFWEKLLERYRNWPGNNARWCTSDLKTSPSMTWITEAVAEFWDQLGVPADRPVEVLYCLGLRGEESSGRAAQPIVSVNERHSSGNRQITRWLPLRDWTIRDVWDEIKEAGLRPHAGYSWGLARLSCSLCVLASLEDLMLAAALRPALAADYRWAEIELGRPFTERLSMAMILAGLDAAGAEAAGDTAAAVDAAVVLYELVRDYLASTAVARGEGQTASGRPRKPWTEQHLIGRATARTSEILEAGRRAVALAAEADTSVWMLEPLDEQAAAVLAGAAR
ncbi:phosphoadenosine phosphosulfate reductase family protein [Nonomuraea fuscirosea]|uniref:phosphoadenosine phosphosulfate reductase domain-containing protein n=1 Tax=Nonomuraea fuscirosea TaxID=1291556 RepID=UPI0033CB8407